MIQSLINSGDLSAINTGIDLAVQLGEIPAPAKIRFTSREEEIKRFMDEGMTQAAARKYSRQDTLILKFEDRDSDKFEEWLKRIMIGGKLSRGMPYFIRPSWHLSTIRIKIYPGKEQR